MLELRWHPNSDSFSFTVKAGREEPITKRSILSQTAQLFDPLGWLAPVVIRAKILIQSTWLKGLDWDATLDEEDCQNWRVIQEELGYLEHIRIPRWVAVSHDSISVELHGFADASERAYAAVVYLRTKDVQERVNRTIVAAKTKVAPLKQVSLPRLELCAATLLSQLLSYIQSVVSSQITATHAWLDSTVALSWIQGHPSRKTFVANRVAKIQRRIPDTSWHHVRSRENPADCASRGVGPRELTSHALWWRDPAWLSKDATSWPLLPTHIGELPEERKTVLGAIQQIGAEPEFLLRYSCLNKLLRITAWCRRWLKKRQQKQQTLRRSAEIAKATYLSAQELDEAQRAWVLVVQSANYPNELAAVAESKPLPRSSPLLNLSPFSDKHGILRVEGRLKHSIIAYDEKHPIILPATLRLTELLVRSCHLKTLGLLRRQFWIPQGRQAVRRHIHRCITCVRWRAATPQQVMADLPRSRVTPARPFQHTGVDYAGPIMLRTSPGQGHKAHKAFLVVFVCLSTKAVHLDVASDYTAEAFLAAFRRFTSRRGLCQTLYSDRGTNFVGADSQLQSLFSAKSSKAQVIAKQLTSDRICWQFNPPSAPHFGGLWEAAVKSMKHHVRRVLGDSSLTYEKMATLLSQVEACLNSRPLQALTDDPNDLAALTPGHFLIGAAINAVPEKSHLETTRILARWQHLQRMRDHFWNRWSREYLQGLITRQKWQANELKLDEGRLCLITNENTPPTKWPLGRIIKLHPGDDGRVRVVTIKTATAERVRPVTKLVLLPCSTATNV